MDAETGHGLVTDVCLKRKVRNFMGLLHGEQPPYEIYVKEKAVLNLQHQRAYHALALDSKKRSSKAVDKASEDRELTRWMCENFYDIRTFCAVMATEVNCGQVRGPVQMTMARSIDPIVPQEHAITRCAVTTEREAEQQKGDNRTMGRKFTVPYALYKGYGYISASLAERTGFAEDDLKLFKRALGEMFEHDHSAARGQMKPVRCVAFCHDNKFGNARSDQLFARIRTQLKNAGIPPRSHEDYEITIETHNLPKGEWIEEWV